MLYKYQILVFCIVIFCNLNGLSQKGNDFTLGLQVSGAGIFLADTSQKNIYSIEISPSLGYQVMENHYIYLTGGFSLSNYNDQELFYLGYITRNFLHKYKFLNFYVGQNFSVTNISYEQSEMGKIQKLNPKFSGFTFGIEGGVHMSLYKNFGIILNIGYNYDYGRGISRSNLLNLTMQLDFYTS